LDPVLVAFDLDAYRIVSQGVRAADSLRGRATIVIVNSLVDAGVARVEEWLGGR
jgi:hypothetical protein